MKTTRVAAFLVALTCCSSSPSGGVSNWSSTSSDGSPGAMNGGTGASDNQPSGTGGSTSGFGGSSVGAMAGRGGGVSSSGSGGQAIASGGQSGHGGSHSGTGGLAYASGHGGTTAVQGNSGTSSGQAGSKPDACYYPPPNGKFKADPGACTPVAGAPKSQEPQYGGCDPSCEFGTYSWRCDGIYPDVYPAIDCVQSIGVGFPSAYCCKSTYCQPWSNVAVGSCPEGTTKEFSCIKEGGPPGAGCVEASVQPTDLVIYCCP